MWELYAMWGWFFTYSIAAKCIGLGLENAALIRCLVIAVGAQGCIFEGWLADHIGLCHATTLLMVVSGMSALLIGLFLMAPLGFLSRLN